MSADPRFVCPIDVRRDLMAYQVKRPFNEDDLVMRHDGATCLFGTPDKLITLPIPGLDLGNRFSFVSSERVASLRKRLAQAVALDILARAGAVSCRDKDCTHQSACCTEPNFLQRACLLTFDDSDQAWEVERDRQHALHQGGYSVHIHYDAPAKKRKSKD